MDGKSYAISISCGGALSKYKFLLNNATKTEQALFPKYMFSISYNAKRYHSEWKEVVKLIKQSKEYENIDSNNVEYTDDKKLITKIQTYGKMYNGRYGDWNAFANVEDKPPCGLHIFRVQILCCKYFAGAGMYIFLYFVTTFYYTA